MSVAVMQVRIMPVGVLLLVVGVRMGVQDIGGQVGVSMFVVHVVMPMRVGVNLGEMTMDMRMAIPPHHRQGKKHEQGGRRLRRADRFAQSDPGADHSQVGGGGE